MCLKEVKFTLYFNLKENFCKIMYHCFMISEKLSRIYKGTSHLCYVIHVDNMKGCFIMPGELEKKRQKILVSNIDLDTKILKIKINQNFSCTK